MGKKHAVRRCAVCGDKSQTDVRLIWRRNSDGKNFDICLACAESGKVNAESVNRYPALPKRAAELEPFSFIDDMK